MPIKNKPGRKTAGARAAGRTQARAASTGDFSLETQTPPLDADRPRTGKPKTGPTGDKKSGQPEVLSYRHSDKRKNNPEVGMVRPENDPDDHDKRWCYDPHIDPASILSAIRKNMKNPSPSGRGEWYQVEVHGFDYFDTAQGELVSGGKGKIVMWLLDTDYDERSLFPRQVFFPMAGKGEGWEKLKKDIRAELNEGLLEKFHGTKSLPFEAGENKKVAVKIVDDRGIESLKIIPLG